MEPLKGLLGERVAHAVHGGVDELDGGLRVFGLEVREGLQVIQVVGDDVKFGHRIDAEKAKQCDEERQKQENGGK